MNTNQQRIHTPSPRKTSALLPRRLMSPVLCRGITRSRFTNWLIVCTQTICPVVVHHSNANVTTAFALMLLAHFSCIT